MKISELQDAANRSAQIYYEYLSDHGKGISSVGIRDIRAIDCSSFSLQLVSRLSANAASNLDGLLFRFYGQDYTSHQIVPIEYDPLRAILMVKPSTDLHSVFSQLSPDELLVFSDLRFLVKRVGDWYDQYGRQISKPKQTPIALPPKIVTATKPSKEQLVAINGALSSHTSYVWGAPGTGKTRVVLASCALSLLHAGKKVLIAAPTNNALEQVLLGLLPILQNHGIALDQRVLRLGTPTTSFADRYPQVCENTGVERQINQTRTEIKRITECLKYRASCHRFENAARQIGPLCSQYLSISENYRRKQKAITSITAASAELRADDALLRRDIDQALSQLQRTQKALKSRSTFFWKHLLPKRYHQLCLDESRAAEDLTNARRKLDLVSERLDTVKRQLDEHTAQISILEANASATKDSIVQLSAFWSELQDSANRLSILNAATEAKDLLNHLTNGAQLISEKSELFSIYTSQSDDELRALSEQLSAKAEVLAPRTTEERLTSVTVVAATLDKFLTLELPLAPFCPDHIFLDEAGYCPLIKGAPLFSLGVPVTFLGDHMQLPPVCEMDVSEQSDECTCLWAQSAIHLDTLFSESLHKIHHDYLQAESPQWTHFTKFDLTETHRFSHALSSILAGYVYSPEFHSVATVCTELIVLDAPRRKESIPRTSTAEIEAITEYLRKENTENFAILSPYRNQVAQLAKRFPSEHKDERILTVHASQGREWDTVFFSVVDTSDMFFCNTLKTFTKGKQVVNTAVSRAKRRLVIVCDYDYWAAQSNQLITDLILSAEKYPSAPMS